MQKLLLKIGHIALELIPYVIAGIFQIVMEHKDRAKQTQIIIDTAKEQAAKTAQEAALSYYRGLK